VRVEIRGAQPIETRDTVLAMVGGFRPVAGGVDVNFVDTQVNVTSADQGRAYLTVEVTTPDRQSGERTVDRRDATVTLARRADQWVITSAELTQPPTRP
jgi:hypothetical protein